MDPITYAILNKKISDLSPQINQEVDAWLNEHPEATTTVQDGAITYAKLHSDMQDKIDDINDLKSAFNSVVETTTTETTTTPTYTTESGYMGTNGAVTSSDSYKHTNKLTVNPGDVVTCPSNYSFRFVTAFDSSNNAISAKGEGSSTRSYTVPEGITGIVVSFSASYSALVITITTTTYSYSVIGLEEAQDAIDDIECSISDILTERDSYDITFVEPTYSPYEMNTSGTVGTSSSYKHTNKISVIAGDVITIYKDNMTRSAFDNHSYDMRFVTAFNGNTAVSASGSGTTGIYTVPNGIDGIVVSVYVANSSQDHEQQIRISRPIKESFPNSFNILNGKKWTACGDSFTAAGYDNTDGYAFNYYTFETGRFAGKNKTYPWIIGLRNNMDIVNMAISGMSMANSTGSNAFVLNDYYKGIPADADYITLKFGINDLNHGTVIGTIDSDDPTTFYGAWNIVMAYITENYPLAKVGIIVTNGLGSANQYADAIIAIAKKWGVPYLDEVYDDKVPLLHRVNRPDVSSAVIQKKLETFCVSPTNTHPNVNAQYYEAAFVENWLKSL